MYFPVEGGSIEDVQGLPCWKPPVGMVWDPRHGGKLVKVGVHKRDPKNKKNCHWEPDARWKLYRHWQAEEKERRKTDKAFIHLELRQFIKEMWLHRLSGYWFSNNGVDTYITGTYWYYLSCYNLDIGLPRYRKIDRLFFYAWKWVEENPFYYGLIEVTKRRSGKTYRAGAIALEKTSRSAQFFTGIQSKSEPDARKVFRKAIISPYRKLPNFFLAKDNMTKSGKIPANQLVFTSDTAIYEAGYELESAIDFGPSTLMHYDGQKMGFYFGDEVGKTKDIDVYERWGIVKPALRDERRRIVGKSFQTTTVEEMDNGGRAFKKLWDNSDHVGAMKEGRETTVTGLARIFFAADESGEEDIYGEVDREKERARIEAEWKGLDARSLANAQRKDPLNLKQAFQSDASTCIYNPTILNNLEGTLSTLKETAYIRGDLHWINGVADVTDPSSVKVVFKENWETGSFKFRWMPPEDLQNNIIWKGGRPYPGNKGMGAIGVDPFDHVILEEGGEYTMSFGAACGIRREDPLADPLEDTLPNGGPAFIYLDRPDNPMLMWEDMIKVSVFYGWIALIERNKQGCVTHFEDMGFGEFAYLIPGQKNRGINAGARSKGGGTNANIAELTSIFIENKHDTVFFLELVEQWKGFSPMDTTKWDLAMAFGYALMLLNRFVALDNKNGRNKKKRRPVTSYVSFNKKRNRGLINYGPPRVG